MMKTGRHACNICGETVFGLGPLGRKSATGLPPRCTHCQSLERHRIQRRIWDEFPTEYLSDKRVLQFSPDPSVDGTWFASYELSVYQTSNSLDLQQIDRPDAVYDIVICSHVLEHVPDDRAALRELVRILTTSGFVLLAVPNPMRLVLTDDWGYPKTEQHGHYRVYGADISVLLDATIGPQKWKRLEQYDPVTGVADCVYILTKHIQTIQQLQFWLDG